MSLPTDDDDMVLDYISDSVASCDCDDCETEGEEEEEMHVPGTFFSSFPQGQNYSWIEDSPDLKWLGSREMVARLGPPPSLPPHLAQQLHSNKYQQVGEFGSGLEEGEVPPPFLQLPPLPSGVLQNLMSLQGLECQLATTQGFSDDSGEMKNGHASSSTARTATQNNSQEHDLVDPNNSMPEGSTGSVGSLSTVSGGSPPAYLVKDFGNLFASADVHKAEEDKEDRRQMSLHIHTADVVEIQGKRLRGSVLKLPTPPLETLEEEDEGPEAELGPSRSTALPPQAKGNKGRKGQKRTSIAVPDTKPSNRDADEDDETWMKRRADALRIGMSGYGDSDMASLLASTLDFMRYANKDGPKREGVLTSPQQDREIGLKRIEEVENEVRRYRTELKLQKDWNPTPPIETLSFSARLRKEIATGSRFICKIVCDRNYFFKEPNNVIACCSCGNTFQTSADLLKHLEDSHSPEVRFLCPAPDCSVFLASFSNLGVHMQAVHGNTLGPTEARSIFVTPESERRLRHEIRVQRIETMSKEVDYNYRKNVGEISRECRICERDFPNFQHLKIHSEDHHSSRFDSQYNRWFNCPFCQIPLCSVQRFIGHIEQEVKTFGGLPCLPNCGLVFRSQALLFDHKLDCYSAWAEANSNKMLKKTTSLTSSHQH